MQSRDASWRARHLLHKTPEYVYLSSEYLMTNNTQSPITSRTFWNLRKLVPRAQLDLEAKVLCERPFLPCLRPVPKACPWSLITMRLQDEFARICQQTPSRLAQTQLLASHTLFTNPHASAKSNISAKSDSPATATCASWCQVHNSTWRRKCSAKDPSCHTCRQCKNHIRGRQAQSN